ncbi:MAG: hypothetical protein WDL87_01910 [Candidatus Omnitrophota bacterium]|jgi:hypothetical protein
MSEQKSMGIALEIVRLENDLPGFKSVIEKAEAEAAEVFSKKLSGKPVTQAEEDSADKKLTMAERMPKRYEAFLKRDRINLLAAVKEERADIKSRRDALRPKEARAKEDLRKKLGALVLEAEIIYNCLRGEVYLTDLLSTISYLFNDRFPDGQDHASEYKNLVDQAAVESKKLLEDSVISQGAELDRLIAINENKNIDLEVEEILTKAREQVASTEASK